MQVPLTDSQARRSHWDNRYLSVGPERVSWFQREPVVSLELLDAAGVTPTDSVIDVGGGSSFLADRLLERGFTDVTVLDVSEVALGLVAERIAGRCGVDGGDESPRAGFEGLATLCADLLEWVPSRCYRVWHDRAVFHFMVEECDRVCYREKMARALEPGGFAIVASFAPDGPPECSQLPVARYSPVELFAELQGKDEERGALSLEMIDARQELHTTPSGATQPFSWVLLRRCS
jgi:SAM-dependent methyltransferase